MYFGSQCGLHAKIFKIEWLKNRHIWVKSYVMMKIHIFDGFSTITQPKIIQFWKFLRVIHIVDQNTTFLFYKFFTLFSAKNTILQISRKTPREIFFNIPILTSQAKCHPFLVVLTLEARKNPKVPSGAVWLLSKQNF